MSGPVTPGSAAIAVGQLVTGTGIAPGTTVASISGNDVTLSAPVASAVSGLMSFGTTAVTLDGTAVGFGSVTLGQSVTGAGIASGTTVAAISGTSLVLSQPATADLAAAATLHFGAFTELGTGGTGQPTLTLSFDSGVQPGQSVAGTGVDAGTLVAAYSPTTLEVSLNTPLLSGGVADATELTFKDWFASSGYRAKQPAQIEVVRSAAPATDIWGTDATPAPNGYTWSIYYRNANGDLPQLVPDAARNTSFSSAALKQPPCRPFSDFQRIEAATVVHGKRHPISCAAFGCQDGVVLRDNLTDVHVGGDVGKAGPDGAGRFAWPNASSLPWNANEKELKDEIERQSGFER